MQKHQDKNFKIYFGDSYQSVSVLEIAAQQITKSLDKIAQELKVHQIALLAQNHGIQGLHITQDNHQNYLFTLPGDYLITQKIKCGIGVVTADCLPIVIYDSVHHAAAIIHAGWKGLLGGIFQVVVHQMAEEIGSKAENLQIYFGPSAGVCCYQVQQDFIDRVLASIPKNLYDERFFVTKDNQIFFEAMIYAQVIARNLGIKQENIYTRYNLCTICTLSFCSYRREKDQAYRQVTMISLY